MRKVFAPAVLFILAVVSITAPVRAAGAARTCSPSDRLVVTGAVSNTHGGPVKGALLSFYANGREVACVEEATTSTEGRYSAELLLPHGILPEARIEIAAQKPCFKNLERTRVERAARESAGQDGAALLMLVSREDIVEMLENEIEWPTLIFFMMLFVVVAGAEQAGFIQVLADGVKELSKGSLVVAILMILWVSALASAIIDNIPFTATMLPIVGYLTTAIPGAQGGVLWWALSLGACLGGNGTMIGASANVVTVGMAEKAGYPVSFKEYFKTAFFPMILSIILCSVWLLVSKG